MQSQLQSHTQAQSSARLRVAGRFLQCLVLLLLLPLSAALAPRAAMAQAQVQTEYRYDPAGNVKSVTSVPLGAAPRLQVVRSPKPMRVGEAARVDWVATDATSLTQSCVPFGGGEPYVQDKPLTGGANVQVSADWVTAPPTCTWTAKNAAGQTTSFVEVLTTQAAPVQPPSITNAKFSPQTVAVGGTSQLCWNAANVARTTVSCSPHYDYQYDVSSTAGGVVCGPADRRAVAAGEGVCTIKGFNAAGATTEVTARITVVAAPEITAAGFASSTVTQGSGNSLSWTLGGSAVSASVTCSGVAAGSGTSSPVAVSTSGTGTGTCTIRAVNAAGASVERSVSYQSVAAPSISGASFSPQTVAVGGTSQLCWNAAYVSRTTVSCSPHYDYQYDVSSTAVGVVCGPADRRAVAAGEGVCTIKGFNAAGATTEVTARITVVAAPEITAAGFAQSTVTQGSGNSLSWTLGGSAVSASVTCSGVAAGSGTSSPMAVSTSGTGTGTCTIRAVNAAGASVERSVSYQSVAAPSISGARFSPQTVTVGGTSQLCWSAAHVSRMTVTCSPHYDYRYDEASMGGDVVCGPADRRAVAVGEGVCTIKGFNAAGATTEVTARIKVEGAVLLSQTYPGVTAGAGTVGWEVMPLNYPAVSGTFELSNNGTGRATNLSIVATAPWTVQNNSCGTSLDGGNRCTYSLLFRPTAVQAYTGSLTVTSDQGSATPYALAGEGGATVLSQTYPGAVAGVSAVDWGVADVGLPTDSEVFTLHNSGTASATSVEITVTGGVFALQNNTCGPHVGSGKTCTYTVSFTPPRCTNYEGRLLVRSAEGEAVPFVLKGKGGFMPREAPPGPGHPTKLPDNPC